MRSRQRQSMSVRLMEVRRRMCDGIRRMLSILSLDSALSCPSNRELYRERYESCCENGGLILDSPGAARTGAETAQLAPESEAYINRELAGSISPAGHGPGRTGRSRCSAGEIRRHHGNVVRRIRHEARWRVARRIERKNYRLSPGRMPREELQLCREVEASDEDAVGWWKKKSARRWRRRVLR
jgi:hypothetical protein